MFFNFFYCTTSGCHRCCRSVNIAVSHREKLHKRPDLPQNIEEAQEVKGTGIVTSDRENKKKVPDIWEKWRKSREVPKKEGYSKVRTNLLINCEGGTISDKEIATEKKKVTSDMFKEMNMQKEQQKGGVQSERKTQIKKVNEVLKVFEGERKKSDRENKAKEGKKVTGKETLKLGEIEKLAALFGETKSKKKESEKEKELQKERNGRKKVILEKV